MVEFPKQSITILHHFLNVRIYPWLGFKPQVSCRANAQTECSKDSHVAACLPIRIRSPINGLIFIKTDYLLLLS